MVALPCAHKAHQNVILSRNNVRRQINKLESANKSIARFARAVYRYNPITAKLALEGKPSSQKAGSGEPEPVQMCVEPDRVCAKPAYCGAMASRRA